MENQENDEIEIDLLELLGVLRKKISSIIIATLLLASVFGFGSMFLVTPEYISSSQMYILSQGSLSFSLTTLQAGSQLASDYMILVESRPVLERVIENLGLEMTYDELKDTITLENLGDSRVLEVTVKNSDPYMAKEIVDEIVDVSSSRIQDIMGTDPPTVIEYGHLEDSPDSPDVLKNILIGGAVGLILSSLVIAAGHILNNNICSDEDVTKYLGLNTLGSIPVESGAKAQMRRDKKKRRKSHE